MSLGFLTLLALAKALLQPIYRDLRSFQKISWGTLSMTVRRILLLANLACSASFCSEISRLVQWNRSTSPCLFRITWIRASIQKTVPSLCSTLHSRLRFERTELPKRTISRKTVILSWGWIRLISVTCFEKNSSGWYPNCEMFSDMYSMGWLDFVFHEKTTTGLLLIIPLSVSACRRVSSSSCNNCWFCFFKSVIVSVFLFMEESI